MDTPHDDTYGLDLSREEVDLLRRIADHGCGGADRPTLARLERLGYLGGEDEHGARPLTARGRLACALVR